ncbi:MAG: hypothetical protein ACYDC8_07435 [Gammaproteobacteria bacterium]
MKKNMLIFTAVLAANATLASHAFATSISYHLNSSNHSALFPKGIQHPYGLLGVVSVSRRGANESSQSCCGKLGYMLVHISEGK